MPNKSIDYSVNLLTPTIVGELVLALGEASFTALLQKTLSSLFTIDYLTLVCFHRHEYRHEIVSVDWIDHAGEVTEFEMAEYLARLWQMDPISQLAQTITTPQLVYLTPECITAPEYKHLFFGNVIGETCTLMGAIENRIYTITLWRLTNSKSISKEALMSLETISNILIPLVSKHAELIPARRSSHKNTPNILTTLFDRRLKYQAIDISIRERAVCLGILYGRSLNQIAEEMNVKPSSATSYRDRAFLKLGLSKNQDLFTWCLATIK